MTFIAGSDHGDYFDPLFLSFSRREKGRSGRRRSYRTTLKKVPSSDLASAVTAETRPEGTKGTSPLPPGEGQGEGGKTISHGFRGIQP